MPSELLVATGKATVDAVLTVEAYAHAHGLVDFAFGAENVQKVWMSVLAQVLLVLRSLPSRFWRLRPITGEDVPGRRATAGRCTDLTSCP